MPNFNKENIKNLILMLEDSNEAIICRNLQGVVTSYNKEAERLYGYTKEEVIGNPSISPFIPEKVEDGFWDMIDKISRGIKVENYETFRKKKNGELVTVSISMYPIYNNAKVVSGIAIVKDVIGRDIFELAIKGGNFGIWDWDISSNDVYFSNVYKAMLGYNNSEIDDTFEDWLNRVHKEDVNNVMDKLKRHFESNQEFTTEYRIKCKDGNFKWIRTTGKVIKWDTQGNPLRMTGTHKDINEEMILRKKNEESENRLIGLYNSVSAGIALGEIILDSLGKPIDYKYLHMNKYIKKFIEVKSEDSCKENDLKLLPAKEENWLYMFAEASLNGKSFTFESYNKTIDKYFHINIYSPNPMQFTLLVTDITENKKKEIELEGKYEELQTVYEELTATEEELRNNYKELEKANEKAEKASKVKSQFLANMSHELRTPLNGILGCTQLLKLSKLSDEQNEDMLMIEKSSNHLLELINDILDLSKIEAGKVELKNKKFNFMEQIQYVIKNLTLLGKNKNIEILYYIDPFIDKELIGDNLRLRQVLDNLISNAVKFTEHGHIFFKVKQIDKNIDETKLQFTVEDTGKGIEEDFRSDIFNKFTQEEANYTKNYGGTGLGLAISKELVKKMGGDIGFESEVGKGSKFHFTAVFKNTTEEDYIIDNKNKFYFEKEITKHKNILVVEDNEINLKIATAFLRQLNYKYVCAHNGQEAIDYLEKNKIDIILMDVQMPILNGYDATKIIRDKEKKVGEHKIIIAMTAYAMNGDRDKFIDCGMDNYISKPFDIETLSEMLKKYENA